MSDCWPKIWGTNIEVYSDDLSCTNVLRVKKGGTCSLHTHKTKHNVFHVISGKLKISTDKGDSVVGEGQSFTIFAGTKHQFCALEDTIAVEVMFVRYDHQDIEREKVGFIDEEIRNQ